MANTGNPAVPPQLGSLKKFHNNLPITLILIAAFLTAGIASPQSAVDSKKSSASSKSADSHLVVVPDLAGRVAKFRRVRMPFNSQGLSARERQMIDKLVDASGLLDCIYWRQSDPEGLKLYLSLAGSKNPQDELLRR